MSRRGPYPLLELTRSRWLEFVRDPGGLFWVFGFPALMAIALGVAFRNRPPEQFRVVVLGPDAEVLRAALSGSPDLRVLDLPEAEAASALRTSRLDAIIESTVDRPSREASVISERPEGAKTTTKPQQSRPGFGVSAGEVGQTTPWLGNARGSYLLVARDLSHGSATIAIRYDPTRPDARHLRLALDDAVQKAKGRVDVVAIEEQAVSETGSRYIDFLLPGLIGLSIMGSCLWGTGYHVVDSRRRRLLKRFAATPMRRSHFLLSFVLSRLGFLLVEVGFVLGFGALAFGLEVRGSLADVTVVALLGAFAFSGLALLVASRTDSTEVASGWINFLSMPMWLLSGAFFDYSRFPDFMLPFIRALPLTAINDALREVINRGGALADIWLEVAILAAWGSASFVLALKWFRWR